jgi:hypothetical protein
MLEFIEIMRTYIMLTTTLRMLVSFFFLLKSHCTGCFCHYQAAICWLTEASCPRSWILSSICCTYLQSVDIPLEKLCVFRVLILAGWLTSARIVHAHGFCFSLTVRVTIQKVHEHILYLLLRLVGSTFVVGWRLTSRQARLVSFFCFCEEITSWNTPSSELPADTLTCNAGSLCLQMNISFS